MPMIRIALYTGDYFHCVGFYEIRLKEALKPVDHELTVHRYPEAFDPAILNNLDMLVLCREGVSIAGHVAGDYGLKWMSQAQEEAIADWTRKGGTLFAWHSGAAGYPENGPVSRLVGGLFKGHPPMHPFEIKVVDPDHPLADGLTQHPVYDELYTFDFFDDQPRPRVFMEGVSTESPVQPIAWDKNEGKGRVVAWLMGHTMETLVKPSSIRLMQNIVQSEVALRARSD